jgi:diguanylate cyclase (GGDEF)-like protein
MTTGPAIPNDGAPQRAKRRKAGTSQGARSPARPISSGDGAGGAAAPSPHPDPAWLAGEVVRLEDELRAMRAQLRELEALAMLDPLTELFNRRGFQRELERAYAHVTRYGGRAVLAYFDLDGFKAVNDRLGHAAGDALLRAIAEALKRRVRASDTVARFGGDEFAVLLWNLSDADAAAKATALERAIALTAIDWEGERIAVGASAGTAPLSGPDPVVAFAEADAAMYRRKRENRGGLPALASSRRPPDLKQ